MSEFVQPSVKVQKPNLYLEGNSVYAMGFGNCKVELSVETVSKNDEQSENGKQKRVYSLQTEEDDVLPDTYAEDNLNVDPPERKYEGLVVEDSTAKKIQEQGRRPVESADQPNPGRLSHAIPIRDPAAYTGAGLTTRRNQEALRQNLDTVVGSSQGMTGSVRTVMNGPHQARRPSCDEPDGEDMWQRWWRTGVLAQPIQPKL